MVFSIVGCAFLAGMGVLASDWGGGKQQAAIVAAGIGALVGIALGKFVGNAVAGKPPNG